MHKHPFKASQKKKNAKLIKKGNGNFMADAHVNGKPAINLSCYYTTAYTKLIGTNPVYNII